MNVSPSVRRRRSGIALVLVLSILILLTAVVLAFFTNATTDLTSSKGFSDELRVRMLGDSAVNVVEGQLRTATQGGTPGQPLAWASQPGVVRTFDDLGRAQTGYKLYSSDVPQFDLTLGAPDYALDIPANWNQRPSDFVDLNTPTIRALSATDPDYSFVDPQDNTKRYSARYPIIDGNFLVAVPGVSNGLVYDSDGNNVSDVDGFFVKPPATYAPGTRISPNNNPVPMPVRWLYVLQNGQLEARDNLTGKIIDASKKNPVVGRIAYWTDDDTCKLNINAASEGTYWSRSRARNTTEVGYNTGMPAQNEFQMFPGHPAKTSLSTVFGAFWPVPDWLTATNYRQFKPYYDLTPRISDGQFYGSAGGTQSTQTTLNTGIPYDADRLYASVDELMFNSQFFVAKNPPNRGPRNVANNAVPAPAITAKFLETARFFLTASNRAPEVTLLNTPRISLWPLQALKPGTGYQPRTAKDKLLAFCSTVPAGSNNLYSFQRLSSFTENHVDGAAIASSDSPTLDFDISKPSGDRNNNLYGYLQKMVQAKAPGLGGSFTQKYGGATNQILTEAVDLMRGGLNTAGNPDPGANPQTQPFYSYTTEGQTMPLAPPNNGAGSRGLGRSCTITEAAIDFFRCNDPGALPNAPIQIGAVLILQNFSAMPGFSSLRPNMQIEVSGLDAFSISDPNTPNSTVSLGMPSPATNIVDAIVGFFTTGNQTEYVGMETSFLYTTPTRVAGLKSFDVGPATSDQFYPFFNRPGKTVGSLGTLPKGATQFNFNPDGTKQLVIRIYSNPNPPLPSLPRQLVQTLTLTFPPSLLLPVPAFRVAPPNPANPAGSIFQARIASTQTPTNRPFADAIIDQNDVVRSVVVDVNGPSKGDLRVIAGLSNVPSTYFTTHPWYDYNQRNLAQNTLPSLIDPSPSSRDYNWRFAHSLKVGDNPVGGGLGWYDYSGAPNKNKFVLGGGTVAHKSAYTGSLIVLSPPTPNNSPDYYLEGFPSVPINLKKAQLTVGANSYPGDWDTGQGALEDGPYANKPDEANAQNVLVYYSRSPAGNETGKTYSPNRQIASGVAFGSLPTGIDPIASSQAVNPVAKPWQTLLFCPNPAAGLQHPGFGVPIAASTSLGAVPAPPYATIPDHYLLDLFTMPIVEPYPLSEPLSSQGKVNMNYQIAPFASYIKRDTAVRAVLKSTSIMAIPATPATMAGYKSTAGSGFQFRYQIDPDETTGTLRGFEDRFASGDIFRSASEICGVSLVPKQFPTGASQSAPYDPVAGSATYASMSSFWDRCRLTGDNVREEPYNDIYPRLTTKSNTFTVHVRVQTLKKTTSTAADTFIDPADPVTGAKDAVTAEYRGSYQIERYIDPAVKTTGNIDPAQNFPDYATQFPGATPLSTFYKFHTIGVKQF